MTRRVHHKHCPRTEDYYEARCACDAINAAVTEERGIIWLAAQMTVALIAEDVERFKEGAFKDGLEVALEEVMTRLEMESKGEHSCTRSDGGKFSAVAEARNDTTRRIVHQWFLAEWGGGYPTERAEALVDAIQRAKDINLSSQEGR